MNFAPPGEPLGPGEIYESNSILLAALASGLGCSCHDPAERARDDRADLDAKLTAGASDAHDALVVAGGVSVGERDFVKERLAAAGVTFELMAGPRPTGQAISLRTRGEGENGDARIRAARQSGVGVRDVPAFRASGGAADGRGDR